MIVLLHPACFLLPKEFHTCLNEASMGACSCNYPNCSRHLEKFPYTLIRPITYIYETVWLSIVSYFNLIKQNVGRKTGIYQPSQEMPFWGNWENFIDNWMKLEKIQIQKKNRIQHKSTVYYLQRFGGKYC